MKPPHVSSRLRLIAVLGLTVAGLAWLIFGVAGQLDGMHSPGESDNFRAVWLRDAHGQLTIDEVATLPESSWQPWDNRDSLRTRHREALWARVTLRNPDSELWHAVVLNADYSTDHVDFWTQAPITATLPADGRPEKTSPLPGSWRQLHSGKALAGKDKPLWGRIASFPVDVPAGGERVCYLRAESVFSTLLRIRWWPRAEDFHAAQIREVLTVSLCFGGMAALLLYNTVLWIRLRFSDIGYYVAYSVMMTGSLFVGNNGLALLGLGLASPAKEMILAESLALSGVFVLQFGRLFLATADRLPKADRVLRYLRTVLLGLALGVPLLAVMPNVAWLRATVIFLVVTHAVLLAVAVKAWRAGAHHARFFVAAFGLLFLLTAPVAVLFVIKNMIPWLGRELLVGSVLEMLLLSLAVSDRFVRLQQDKLAAQQQVIEEVEQRQAMQEAYADELELEVRERTSELTAVNADKDRMLAILGHDLRSPLTALTQIAGQIRNDKRVHLDERGTPETLQSFAGEVEGAGRQLLLLIEDIVLWAHLRAEGPPTLKAHRATSLVLPAAHLHRAAAERRQVRLTVDTPENLLVQTDLVLAQTLVRNLVANAVKFARTRVDITACANGDGVRLIVCDDGPGLPATVAASLRGEGAFANGGMGLRLCQEIGVALGVPLEAIVPSGGGTEMSVTLPAAKVTGENR